MRSIKILEMLIQNRIDELVAKLKDEIFEESLKSKPNARKRYSAMKKYFTYRDNVREVCTKPCEVEFQGKQYTSFTNSYSLALTTESVGEIELFNTENGNYPDVARLINLDGDEDKIDFERVISKAKSLGYKLTKANFDSNNFLMHYKGSYFRMALVDATYSIIADGEEATVYHSGKLRPITVKNDIGYCIILPIRFEGSHPSNAGSVVIEAIPTIGGAMSNEEISELINRRRRQILVHSIIYYKFDDNLISDYTWSKWANELAELQEKYPEIAKECVFAEAYADFDPSTGYNLPLDDERANKTAARLLAARDKRVNGGTE